ncbi:Tetratricopeptide TPR_4 [Parafrankia sp. EAN1pec]|nr:Tetratricopeptide TPR_4 [Frankia sp. EAN1pec]
MSGRPGDGGSGQPSRRQRPADHRAGCTGAHVERDRSLDAVVVPDPSGVNSPEGLAAALGALRRRAGLSVRDMEMTARKRGLSLPRTTASDAENSARPRPSKPTVSAFLDVCDVPAAERVQWLAAWERAGSKVKDPPAGWVRVEDADPYRLGVHQPIQVDGAKDDDLPTYVARDVDEAVGGVRSRLAAAAEHGGLVLLVGDSSVGKTRTAYEAVRAELPGWWLVHPADAVEVAALVARRPRRLVVWLDEIQNYLDADPGLTAGVLRDLLDGAGPVVVVATIWPYWHSLYTSLPSRDGNEDLYREQRMLLRLAREVHVPGAFSDGEQGRAELAAQADPKLRTALAMTGYGLTQTLAAAPQLVARWERARGAGGPSRGPYRWAVLTAALDAARLGARGPLPTRLLEAAAPGYLDDHERARAPADWFDDARAYAIDNTTMHGAAAALEPTGPGGMGQVTGYTPADYLVQYATRTRRRERPPASLWIALRDHLTDPADVHRVADAAFDRYQYGAAVPLLHKAADAGYRSSAGRLAGLLLEVGDVDGLRDRAAAGDGEAARVLSQQRTRAGDLEDAADVLRPAADAGDWRAAARLIDLMLEVDDLDGLAARAEKGDKEAAVALALRLAEAGDVDQLRARADTGDPAAAGTLAEILAKAGDVDELRARAGAGDIWAADWLAELLVNAGDRAGAIAVLRAAARDGVEEVKDVDQLAWLRACLAEVLLETGDHDGAIAVMRAADMSDPDAVDDLVDVLVSVGDRDGAMTILRPVADAGGRHAATHIAELLVEGGHVDELRDRALGGDQEVVFRLVDVLLAAGDRASAITILAAGADAGDWEAADWLAALLLEDGDRDGAITVLRDHLDADDGGNWIIRQLVRLLHEAEDHEGLMDVLRARTSTGDTWATQQLVELLVEAGDDEGARAVLRARANAGDARSAFRLVTMLTAAGDRAGAIAVLRAHADAGNGVAAFELAAQLSRDGELDELSARATADDTWAGARLHAVLSADDDQRLHRYGLTMEGEVADGPTW